MLRRLKLLRVAARLKRSRCVDVFVLFVIAGWFFIRFNANFQKHQIQTSFKIIIFHLWLLNHDSSFLFISPIHYLEPYHQFFIIEVLSLLEVDPLLLNH